METVLAGRLFRVTRRFIQKKGRRSLHETVHHPGSCAVLALLNQTTVLLLRQFRPSIGKSLWEIPAGTLERGESPLTCARREMEEETGYRARRMKRLVLFYPSPGFCTEKIYLFLAEKLKPVSQRLESDETIRVYPVPLQRVFRLLEEGEIVDAKTLIALYLLRSSLSRARHRRAPSVSPTIR